MTERSGNLRTQRPGHRAPKRLRSLGGGLRSWLAVRCTCTPAHRFPGGHSSDPGIRGPLHPLLLRCPPSPYRSGYASVGRLAGSGASTLSMHGLFRNGPREAGLTAPLLLRRLRSVPGPLGDAGEGREAAYGARKQASPRRAGIRSRSVIRSERAQDRERSFAGPAPASPGPRMRASRCGGAA